MPEFNKSEIFSDFAELVAREPGGEGIRKCFSCGTCSAGCPIRRINSLYNPRKIIRMILLGMKNRVLESDFIWLCSSCYTCQERCPQDVKITDMMTAVRNLASKHGYLPSGIKMQADLIGSQGRLYPLDEFDDKKRKKAGLPSLPFTIDEVIKLLEE
ncbi:4Fe-4S dicluster domain-containing protein [Thermodesulfobacteriota bacterium]